MKDFLGNELSIGDTVVMIRPQYRELFKTKIIRFTKCYVILDSSDIDGHYGDTIKQTPDQMIKVSE